MDADLFTKQICSKLLLLTYQIRW